MNPRSNLPRSTPISWSRMGLLLLVVVSVSAALVVASGRFSPAPPAAPMAVAARPPSPVPAPGNLPPAAGLPAAATDTSPSASPEMSPNQRFQAAVEALTDNPHLRAWAQEPGIIDRLTAALNLVSEGESPRPLLAFLAPRQEFEVVPREGGSDLVQSSRSIERYDLLTRTLTSLSPAAVARFYVAIRPLAQASLAAISKPGRSIDAVTAEALSQLSGTTIPAADPALVSKGAGYAFADPALESLPPVEKSLLRLGVDHARAVHAWVTAVERALPLHRS